MLFLGKHEYSMDERGRVPIPPRYRDDFVKGAILTQGSPDLCIRIYQAENFEDRAAAYMSGPATDDASRARRRNFLNNAYPAELDRQGRVLIPTPLRAYAQLSNPLLVTGMGDWLEIWNPAVYEAATSDGEDGPSTGIGAEA